MPDVQDKLHARTAKLFDCQLNPLVYARHGRELMGCDSTKLVEVKSPVCKPCNVVRHDKKH
jgi:hypothetical protein